MDLVLIRLTDRSGSPSRDPAPEILTDILWAAVTPEDRLEHIRARHGPEPGCLDIAFFHRSAGTEPGRHPALAPEVEAAPRPDVNQLSILTLALPLCHRALTSSPALSGWTAMALPLPAHVTC